MLDGLEGLFFMVLDTASLEDDLYDEEDEDDYCYECGGYGDDYYVDENGEFVCRCPECSMNLNRFDED